MGLNEFKIEGRRWILFENILFFSTIDIIKFDYQISSVQDIHVIGI